MTKILGLLALLAVTMAVPNQAHAIFELRATYGLVTSSPNLTGLNQTDTAGPSAFGMGGLGADALVSFPLTGLGVGLRYEDLGITANANGYGFKAKSTRTAALLSYRLIDTFLHIGPIFSYGLSNSGYIEANDNNGKVQRWEPGSVTSYSAGVEAGVSLIAFVVGAEAGYQSSQYKDLEDKSGTSSKKQNVDLNGAYTKVFVGVGF